MDTTAILTLAASFFIVVAAAAIVGGVLYGILVWYPSYLQRQIAERKASGRQGEATIIRLPEHELQPPGRRGLYTLVPIGLEIRVVGLDPFEVDKTFTVPTSSLSLLEKGKIVSVWVDPNNPRNLDRIVIDLK